jgi:hypothetical protein
MDAWAREDLRARLELRGELRVGPLLCVGNGPQLHTPQGCLISAGNETQ